MSSEAVETSINAAKDFFATVFPEIKFKAFLCYSWLLYPPMVNRLPKESNIRQFADRFTIIGTCGEPEQAMHNLQLRKEAQKHGKSPGKVPLFYMGKNAGYRLKYLHFGEFCDI